MTGPDWRKILVAYIAHVRAIEGIDFLPAHPDDLDGLNLGERADLYEAATESVPARDVHALAALRKAAADLRELAGI